MMNEIITVTESGVLFSDSTTFSQWSALGKQLGRAAASVQFAVGDWLVYGEDRWRGQETFDFGAELAKTGKIGKDFLDYACVVTGIDRDVLKKYAHVARHVSPQMRRESLAFKHHEVLAKLEPDDQQRWISLVEKSDDRVSSRQLAKSIELSGDGEDPKIYSKQEIVDVAMKERPIYIDAPEASLARFIRSLEAQDFSEWTDEMKENLRRRFAQATSIIESL